MRSASGVVGPLANSPTTLALMRGAFTRVYRRACLDYWRKRYGETFAARVEREFMRVWKKPVEAA